MSLFPGPAGTRRALFALTVAALGSATMALDQTDTGRMGLRESIETAGAPGSLVAHIETGIVIPGTLHRNLWVHPHLVTVPGDPIVAEFGVRTTDRRGDDRHTAFNWFHTRDRFRSVEAIAAPSAVAWRRVGLTPAALDLEAAAALALPAPPPGVWHWARNCTSLSADTVIHPLLVRHGKRCAVQTVVGSFRGATLVPAYASNVHALDAGRGFLEPQIARLGDRLTMTLRAEDGRGYVTTTSDAGRSWARPEPWCWDDGTVVAMHTTMTKLLSHSDGLLLVYTRQRDDNADVFRHRAPLHCADVDPESLRLRRNTERIIVPNRGLPIGNFWVQPIDQRESWVTVCEWPRDGRSANGDMWLAKIRWRTPNTQMTEEGREMFAADAPPARPAGGQTPPRWTTTDVHFFASFDRSLQSYVVCLPRERAAEIAGGAPTDVLIALHGHGSDRWQFVRDGRDECRAARDVALSRGMVYVSPDYRAPASWMGPAAEADMVQLIGNLKRTYRVSRLFLTGGSMGGTGALTFAALYPDLIDGVAAMNGTANLMEYDNFQDAIAASFGGTKQAIADEYRKRSAELHATALTMPVGLTTSGRDTSVPPDSVLRLAQSLNAGGHPAVRHIHRPAAGHTTSYDDARAIIEFVLEAAPPPAAEGTQ